jgi:excisionase family DNA binding protein
MKLREGKIVRSNAETEKQRIEIRQKKLSIQMEFSIAETAQLLGVCRKTVYNFVYSGKLKAKRITNRTIIISRENINEFLQVTHVV